ncbi:hypothetical protein YC2023_011330 [Brassica napus]
MTSQLQVDRALIISHCFPINPRQLTSSVSVKLRGSKLPTAGITSLKLQRRGIFFHMHDDSNVVGVVW